MALVKKYQNAAGPLPQGKFTKDGRSLLGQMALDRIAKVYESTSPGPRDMYQVVTNAIKAGKEAVYDPIQNTIQILDNDGKDITSSYISKGITASPNDSEFKKNWGATFNTKNHRFKESGFPLANVDMDTREELRRGSGWFDSNNDTYDTTSILNRDREDLIKSLLGYATDERNVDDFYKYSKWSNNDKMQLRNLRNELLSYDGGTEGFYNDFINRLHSGTLSEGDINLLKLMGFSKPVVKSIEDEDSGDSEGENNSENSEERGDKTPKGDGDGSDNRSAIQEGVVIGEDGKPKLIGKDFSDSTWYLGGFDNFAGTKYKDGFAINGNVYTLDEVLNDRSFDPYVAEFITAGRQAHDWNSFYDAANASPVRFLDDRKWAQTHYNIKDPSTYYGGYQNYNEDVYSPDFSDYFSSQDISSGGVKNITPWFKDDKGYKVITYVTPKYQNAIGEMIPQYAVYLGNGQYSSPYTNLDSLVQDYKLEIDPYNQYIQTTLPLNTWNNGTAEHARFKTADGTQENTIIRDKNGVYYLQGNNRIWEIPKENVSKVYELLEQGADLDNKEIRALTKKNGSRVNNTSIRSPKEHAERMKAKKANKLQIGGILTSSSPVTGAVLGKYEEPKEPRKHDITKAHNLDNSDGGLTKAEELQIAGAIADLGGVVSSFAGPVGGVVGAGAGLTGTGLRFAGDLQQGEKSTGRAIKDLAINAAFDIAALPASLIPGLDNAIKASKFVRVVKGIGTPILKYMGTLGLSSALINTASKIINGDKYTSDDLIQLAYGLSGGLVSGKMWSKQIGDSRLAAKGSEKAISKFNSNLKTTFKTKVGDADFTLKNSDIENIVTESKGNKSRVIEKLISKAKENGIEMTEEQASKTLSDFNIYKKKGNIFSAIFKKNKVEFDAPTEKETVSAVEYFFHPLKRNRALGNIKGNAKQGNVVKTITKEEYDNALFKDGVPKRTKDFTAEGALRRLGAQNPKALGFETVDDVTFFKLPFQYGRRASVRPINNPTVKPINTPVVKTSPTTSNILALPAPRVKQVGTIIPSGPTVEGGYTPVLQLTRGTNAPTTIISSGDVISGYSNLNVANAATKKFNSPIFWKQASLLDNALYPLRRKTTWSFPTSEQPISINVGPKRIKFNIGELSKFRAEMRRKTTGQSNKKTLEKEDVKVNSLLDNKTSKNTLQELENLGKDPTFRELVNKDPKSARELIAVLRNEFSNAKYKNKSTAEKDAYFNKRVREMKIKYDWRFKEGGQLPKYQSGGWLGDAFRVNISPIMNLSSALLQNKDISKSYNYLREYNSEAKKRQFITPQVQLPTFNASPIEHKYNLVKKPLLNTKFSYSDPTLNLAGKLSVSEQLSNLGVQKGAELSDYTNQYNQNRLAALNQISQIEANNANEKSAYITNLNALDKRLDAQELNEKWANIWNTYSQEFRSGIKSKEDQLKSLLLEKKISDLKEDFDLRQKNLLKDLYTDYDKSDTTLNFTDWVSGNSNQYSKYKKILEGEGWKTMKKDYEDKYRNLIIKSLYAKQGAKLTSKERLVLQGDKEAKAAVREMNKTLVQLLLKIMK